jgi:hypothetical protein
MMRLPKLLLLVFFFFASSANAALLVPFVGCPGDGVFGPESPATGHSVFLNIPQIAASKLAVYGAGGLAVLAPRGWSCKYWQANSSEKLSVFADPSFPFGPAVVASIEGGGGSDFWADYFPSLFKPYFVGAQKFSTDKLTYIATNIVEYVTPPHQLGLGVNDGETFDVPSPLPSLPSYGLLAVEAEHDTGAFILSVRLPSQMTNLKSTIISFFARCMNGKASVSCLSGGSYIADGQPLNSSDE